jgi:hypothetical protein
VSPDGLIKSGARGIVRIAAVGDRLAVHLWEYPRLHYANSKGAWWYEIKSGRWSRILENEFLEPLYWDGARLWLKQGQRLIRLDPSTGQQRTYDERDEPALKTAGIAAMAISGNEAWFCGHGTWDKEQKDMLHGGVFMLHLLTNRWRFYTTADGLGNGYCADLGIDADHVWVSHWDHEKGLSRFVRSQYHWEPIRKAANQSLIGGPLLALDGERVWIGQQRGVVRYDAKTQDAVTHMEADGLPGYITSDLVVDLDAVWAGMYAYGAQNFHGVRSSGLVRFKRAATQ